MDLFDRIERMHRIHKLILHKATGSPEEFAHKLNVTERQLYNILAQLKSYGAIIKYNSIRGSYYYRNNFEFSATIKVNPEIE